MHYALCINFAFTVSPMWDLEKPMHYQIYALWRYALWAIVLYIKSSCTKSPAVWVQLMNASSCPLTRGSHGPRLVPACGDLGFKGTCSLPALHLPQLAQQREPTTCHPASRTVASLAN